MANEKHSDSTGSVRQKVHDGVDKIIDKAESIGESGSMKMEQLKEKAAMMKENVDGYIQNNPGKSLLIAAGIGAVVGGLIGAALMRRDR